MNDIPEGTVTFLFTDIEGSTRLWQDRPEEMQAALEQHDALMRRAIDSNGGYVFATGGDGFAASFGSASEAVTAATSAQAGLDENKLLAVRMGLHTGEAQVRDGDYFGSAVNRAARIMSAGHGRQVLLSGATAPLVERHALTSLGEHRLKDLEGETIIWQLGGESFPPLRTLDKLPGNLPAQRTSFIGREDEVKAIGAALETEHLVTLIGPGGVGKSRLALQVAAELSADLPGGVWFAPLGALTDGAMVPNAIVDALGIGHRRGETALDVLCHWYSQRESLLLIDNCEHVVDDVAAVVDRLLDTGAGSRVLATSQSPLGLAGEIVHSVAPLTGGDMASESVQLFVDRARMARSDFELTDDNEAAVIEICERLDQIPLAIELAASRVRSMGPADIARRLDQRFRLLSSTDRSAPGRHRTLDAAVRWSYELLDDTQRSVLRRLSVIAGSFTLEAAELIAAGDGVENWEVLDGLLSLVDKSLVVASEVAGFTRYRLLETIRQFGRAELEAQDEYGDRSRRADGYYSDLVRDLSPKLVSAQEVSAHATLTAEWQNVRAALRTAADETTTSEFDELFVLLGMVWVNQGRNVEGAQWSEELLDRPVAEAERRVAALGVAAAAVNSVSVDAAAVYVDAAIALWEEHGTAPPVVALSTKSLRALMQGDNEEALKCCEESLLLRDHLDRREWAHSYPLNMALSVFGLTGELERFAEVRSEADEYVDLIGSRWVEGTFSAGIATAIHVVDPDGARQFLLETLELTEDLGNMHTALSVAMFLGLHDLRSGDLPTAAITLRRALEMAVDHGPAYTGQIVNASCAVLLNQWPESAATLLGALARYRRERHQVGTQLEIRAESHYERALREVLGAAFDPLYAAGGALREPEMVDAVYEAFGVIEAS